MQEEVWKTCRGVPMSRIVNAIFSNGPTAAFNASTDPAIEIVFRPIRQDVQNCIHILYDKHPALPKSEDLMRFQALVNSHMTKKHPEAFCHIAWDTFPDHDRVYLVAYSTNNPPKEAKKMRKKIRTQVDRENLQHAVDFFIDEVEKCINNYLQKEEKAAT